ncbi:MAG: [Clostridia bacterium]|nr:[FeFe] hydrogenase H-cluster maturation GTPase HydF [Clostridia bacterium]
MSLNETVSAERIHIGFFGMRNAGKSSLVNAVTGQELSVVSEVKGTTTDPVKKAMELLPLGPVLIIDTPGFDDAGSLGEKRVAKTNEILAKTDIAVLAVDPAAGLSDGDRTLLSLFAARKLPYLLVYTKADLVRYENPEPGSLLVSSVTREGVDALKNRLGDFAKTVKRDKKILADLVTPGDVVVLVIPIDESAPKGRLILPQQQVLRELLDLYCVPVCCQPETLAAALDSLKAPPRLVVTDSQAFRAVAAIVPDDVPLTSFSILFARYKGELTQLLEGAAAVRALKTGDRVLISEGCTHHRQCNDIGTVKLPNMLRKLSGAEPAFSFTSGGEFPADLSDYALVVHCGGCMLSETEMRHRLDVAKAAGVPIVNYGVAIASATGILERAVRVFGL